MKSTRVLLSMLAISVCAFALVIVAGCSPAVTSGSSSASSSASASGSSSAVAQSGSSSTSGSTSSSSTAAKSSAASPEPAPSSSAASAGSGQLTAEEALAQGYQVFEGTVRVVSAQELLNLQAKNIDPAAASNGGTYAVLVFDHPTEVTGMSGDGSGKRTERANMLGIAEHTDYSSFVVEYGDLDACRSLDGKHVTLAAKADSVSFPSDVRLPIGEPAAKAVVVLK